MSNKFPRTVHELALSCGKEVQLEMHGQDTELDRTMIKAIKDPLTHGERYPPIGKSRAGSSAVPRAVPSVPKTPSAIRKKA